LFLASISIFSNQPALLASTCCRLHSLPFGYLLNDLTTFPSVTF
jgi:hypothetical protein